jgi:hypothetical protein
MLQIKPLSQSSEQQVQHKEMIMKILATLPTWYLPVYKSFVSVLATSPASFMETKVESKSELRTGKEQEEERELQVYDAAYRDGVLTWQS